MQLSGKENMKNTDEILPQELVMEILSWLPIKHLYPLRFVSKSWLRLLTKDHQFAKLQFDRYVKSNPNPSIISLQSINNSDLLLATDFESCDEALTLQLPFYKPNYIGFRNTFSLCGSCNGLLCFHPHDQKEVYIWNPLTNDYITISCLPLPLPPKQRSQVYYQDSIAFGIPSARGYRDSTVFGFGFDQDSNLYKVVRFYTEMGSTRVSLPGKSRYWTQISVYTIGVDSAWRTVKVDLPCFLVPGRILPLVNGVLHWEEGSLISTFDLKREVIGELQPPCGLGFNEIVELSGFLCHVVDQSDVSEVHIWVMKEYGQVSSWSKQYVIAKPEQPQECFDELVPSGFTHNGEIIMDSRTVSLYRLYFVMLGFTHNGEIIIAKDGVPKDGEDLLLYNPETNTVRGIKGFPVEVFLPYVYIGSIISPTIISRAAHNLLEEES